MYVCVLVARLNFCHSSSVKLSLVQSAILLGLGLQHKTVDQLEASGWEGVELGLDKHQSSSFSATPLLGAPLPLLTHIHL